jgi:hypothetical protein
MDNLIDPNPYKKVLIIDILQSEAFGQYWGFGEWKSSVF